MLKKPVFVVLFILILIGTVLSQDKEINLSVIPGVEIAVGPLSADGDTVYTFGGSVSLTGEYPFPVSPLFFIGHAFSNSENVYSSFI